VYGHEKRITQALEGKWKDIDKGPDHLAQIELARRLDDASKNNRSASGRRATSRRVVSRSYDGGGEYSTRVSSSGSTANDVFRRSFGY
jgi:hypothetical protein